MPQGNGKGPLGAGPMSGRGLGYCSGNDSPGFTRGCGGYRGGRGGGGFRNRFFQTGGIGRTGFIRPEDSETAYLREEIARLKSSLERIEARQKETGNSAHEE